MTIDDCKLVSIPTVSDIRGYLSIIEDKILPFKMKRIFYIYNSTNNADRGGHAHKEFEQFIISLSGSLRVLVDDGDVDKNYQYILSNPGIGLYIPPMIWVKISDLKKNDVCLVLTSDYYSENDYIRDYKVFLDMVKK